MSWLGTVRVINVTSQAHTYFTAQGGIDFQDVGMKNYWWLVEWRRYGQSKVYKPPPPPPIDFQALVYLNED